MSIGTVDSLLLSENLNPGDYSFEKLEESFTDDAGRKQKKYGLRGKMMQAMVPNGNDRVYLFEGMVKAVERYQKPISAGTAWGEMNHPPKLTVNPERTVLLFDNLAMDGKDAVGYARIITENNPLGQLAIGIMNAGGKFGVSSRAAGLVKKGLFEKKRRDIVHAFDLRALDLVHGPSGPNCYPEFITESKIFSSEFLTETDNLNWAVDLGVLCEEGAEIFESLQKEFSARETEDASEQLLSRMLDGSGQQINTFLTNIGF